MNADLMQSIAESKKIFDTWPKWKQQAAMDFINRLAPSNECPKGGYHNYQSYSPIDTLETCTQCGQTIGCESLI